MRLVASNILSWEVSFDPRPNVTAPTLVADYRYRRLRGQRLFTHATYLLEPGQPWRTEQDPELLAQAEEFLRQGSR